MRLVAAVVVVFVLCGLSFCLPSFSASWFAVVRAPSSVEGITNNSLVIRICGAFCAFAQKIDFKKFPGWSTHVSHIRFLCPFGYARAKLPPTPPMPTDIMFPPPPCTVGKIARRLVHVSQAIVLSKQHRGCPSKRKPFFQPLLPICDSSIFDFFLCTREYRTKHLQEAARAGVVWDTSYSRVWLPCRSSAAPTSASRSPRPFVVLRRAINAQTHARTRAHIIFTKSSTFLPGCVLIFCV